MAAWQKRLGRKNFKKLQFAKSCQKPTKKPRSSLRKPQSCKMSQQDGEEIASRAIMCEMKRIWVDLKANPKGKFLKISEQDSAGNRQKIIVPLSGCGRCKQLDTFFKKKLLIRFSLLFFLQKIAFRIIICDFLPKFCLFLQIQRCFDVSCCTGLQFGTSWRSF